DAGERVREVPLLAGKLVRASDAVECDRGSLLAVLADDDQLDQFEEGQHEDIRGGGYLSRPVADHRADAPVGPVIAQEPALCGLRRDARQPGALPDGVALAGPEPI